MIEESKDPLVIWQAIMDRAESRLGKARAEALRSDLEQVVAEISQISAWPISHDDDPA